MRYVLFALVLLFLNKELFSQQLGNISGNFGFEGQYYQDDEKIGTEPFPQDYGAQGFMNIIYNVSDFEIGFRYENYSPPLLGIDSRFEGSGFPYLYATYRSERLDVTAGNFYDQFGSGLIFRAYEEKALGFDNSMNGVRAVFRPIDGIELRGVVGKQREFWTLSDGILRGLDANIIVNDLIPDFISDDYTVILGGSMMSKYEADRQSFYNLPENVLAYAGRASFISGSFSLDAEYAFKYNDPGATNEFTFNNGNGILINTSYYESGFSATLNYHRVDNMDFRSERSAIGNVLNVNFIPPLTKQHTYSLTSLYPYATQLNGESGFQGEITYNFEKDSFFGGEYGTNITANYSLVRALDSSKINEFVYESNFFGLGQRTYFQDFNFEITKRWTDKIKTNFTYINLTYDKDVIEGGGVPQFGKVYSDLVILDFTYKIDDENAIRTEIQHIWSDQDSTIKIRDNINGNWGMLLLEYTISPNYFFTVSNEYNYGNEFEDARLHYTNFSFAYLYDATRIQLSYGRQRGGIVCIGGVCRPVPASSGMYLSLSSTF